MTDDGSEYYYNKTVASLVRIPSDWPDAAKTAQRTLLTGKGYKPVDMTGAKEDDLPFVRYHYDYKDDGDKYTVESVPINRYVALSQDKLVRNQHIQSRMEDLMAALSGDSVLSSWWANDMRYLRGSPVAEKAMAVFGLTQEQMEQIVLACRA